MLGIRLWHREAEMLRAVAANQFVAVKAGQKVSKSHSAAIVAIWWAMTKPRAEVLLLAPSYRQVRYILWKEIRRLHGEAPNPLGGEMHLLPSTGWRLPGGKFITGFSTTDPQKVQGRSGKNLLIIVDEANGLLESLWEPIMGNLSGGGHLLALGNPIENVGTWSEAWNKSAALWHTLTVSALESPNYVEGRDVFDGLATEAFIEKMRIAYGEGSPYWQARVLGQFPEGSDTRVVSMAAVELALSRWEDMGDGRTALDGTRLPAKRLEIGLDVARFGDDESVSTPRLGNWLGMPKAVHGFDGVQVAEMVIEQVRELRASKGERAIVKIDGSALSGSSPADQLRHNYSSEVEVHEVSFGGAATDERLHSMRCQLWWCIRDYIDDGGSLPPDTKLQGELTAPRYGFDARNRIHVQSKDEIKKELKRSPDRADSVALAIYQPQTEIVSPIQPKSTNRWGRGSGRGF